MSSRAEKMEKQVLAAQMPPQKTKEMTVRIDVCIPELGAKSTYVVITGIPEDLPAEYESTVIKTAERQFAQALNQRLFLEFYTMGKTAADEQPIFINLSRIDSITITNIQKVN